MLVDGAALKRDSLTAPTSIYAVVIKANREYPLLIAKPTDRTIKIFTARCPHQGTILNLSSHGEFRCELHGARFDETTGKVLDGPTINNLDQYSPIIKDGRLYISI